jgi:hypothetical protein
MVNVLIFIKLVLLYKKIIKNNHSRLYMLLKTKKLNALNNIINYNITRFEILFEL